MRYTSATLRALDETLEGIDFNSLDVLAALTEHRGPVVSRLHSALDQLEEVVDKARSAQVFPADLP